MFNYYKYKRYAKYLVQYLGERIRGIDFTMRDLSLIEETGGVLHGYSKTDDKHAEEILDCLDVDCSKKLLDIGCGKGAFLRDASYFPFGEIAGLEYSSDLAKIAEKNMKKLNLQRRVKVIRGDACRYSGYENFNVFYFFNPFNKEVMNRVLRRILYRRSDPFWIILHNPVCADEVLEHGLVEKERLFDDVKQYETVIYKWEHA